MKKENMKKENKKIKCKVGECSEGETAVKKVGEMLDQVSSFGDNFLSQFGNLGQISDDGTCGDSFHVCNDQCIWRNISCNGKCPPPRKVDFWDTADDYVDCNGKCINPRDQCEGKCNDERNNFPCPNSTTQCMEKAGLCDGFPDCSSGGDESEEYCNKCPGMFNCTECLHSHPFQCKKEQKCLKAELFCNGNKDCIDGSDETDCDECPGLYNCWGTYICKNDMCVPKSGRSSCYEQMQMCDGKCISEKTACGGKCKNSNHRVCGDKCVVSWSKEQECDGACIHLESQYKNNSKWTSPCEGKCPYGFKCHDGSACLTIGAECDGIKDCIDGSDEDKEFCEACGKYIPYGRQPGEEFSCLTEPQYGRCDDKKNYYLCGDKCILKTQFCQTTKSCFTKNNSDKKEYDDFNCDDQTCVDGQLRCNGVKDCKNGKDEENCPDCTKRHGAWTCGDQVQCKDTPCDINKAEDEDDYYYD